MTKNYTYLFEKENPPNAIVSASAPPMSKPGKQRKQSIYEDFLDQYESAGNNTPNRVGSAAKKVEQKGDEVEKEEDKLEMSGKQSSKQKDKQSGSQGEELHQSEGKQVEPPRLDEQSKKSKGSTGGKREAGVEQQDPMTPASQILRTPSKWDNPDLEKSLIEDEGEKQDLIKRCNELTESLKKHQGPNIDIDIMGDEDEDEINNVQRDLPDSLLDENVIDDKEHDTA